MKVWRLPVLALALCAGAGIAFAGIGHDEARRLRERGEILPLSRVLEKATAVHPGRVLEVELERRRGGDYVYEVEIMDNQGTVWEMHVDARTGRVIDRDRED